jgi:hypothetical protein
MTRRIDDRTIARAAAQIRALATSPVDMTDRELVEAAVRLARLHDRMLPGEGSQ